jgi:ferredoxin-NADP reductase
MAEYQMIRVDRQRIAKDTMAFWFDTNDANFEFRPRQHADFVFARPRDGSAGDNSRTFSVASSPHDKSPIMIARRMRKTGFKSALQAAAIGTRFIVSRPRGSFTRHKDVTRTAVFLASGIGITPVRSILLCAAQERLPHARNPNSIFIPTVTGHRTSAWPYEKGQINRDMLTRYLLGLKGPIYYIAGPSGMFTAMTGLLKSSGVSGDDMKTEEFGGYKLYQDSSHSGQGTGTNPSDSGPGQSARWETL